MAATSLSNTAGQRTVPPELAFLAPFAVSDLIRVGKDHDGGYVIPYSSIEMADFLVSFGLSDDWSFEEQFKKLNPGIQIHAYDHTVSGRQFRTSFIHGLIKLPLGMTSLGDLSRRYHLLRSYKRFFRGGVLHFEERITRQPSRPADVAAATVLERATPGKLFLKVDIEGGEYEIIEDLISHAHRIVGMVIEFHNTNEGRQLFVSKVKSLLAVYEIVHLHSNNFAPPGAEGFPEVVEISFAKTLQHSPSAKRRHLPIPGLDSPNNPLMSDYQIEF